MLPQGEGIEPSHSPLVGQPPPSVLESRAMSNSDFALAHIESEDRAELQIRREELTLDALEEFEEACRRLLHTGRQRLVLDMGHLPRIHSGFIGVVLYANSEAGLAGRELEVVATPRVAAMFEKVAPGVVRTTTPDK